MDSDRLLFQIYCLNPPSDSCAGLCPNSDVTGVGQQVSLYITATTFTITLLYFPQDIKSASTAYLANIYSLLVSALISLTRGELTRNDAHFVLIATVSPATLYLWILVCFAAFNNFSLPDYLKREITNKVGQHLLIFSSLVSLLLWIVVTALSLRPISYFSQPACDKEYHGRLADLVWSATFLVRLCGVATVTSVIARYRWKFMAGRGAPTNLHSQQGLASYTRASLSTFTPLVATPPQITSLLLIMQVSDIHRLFDLPTINFLRIPETCFCFMIVMLDSTSTLYQRSNGVWVGREGWQRMSLAQRCTPFVFIIIFVGTLPSLSHSPLSFGECITGVCWSFFWWCHIEKSYSGKNPILRRIGQIFLVFLVFFSLALPDLLNRIQWLSYCFVPQLWWFCAWEISSFIPSSSGWEDTKRVLGDIMESAPIFKFTFLVLVPTWWWVQATTLMNPTMSESSTMTFGQIFALLVAVASLALLATKIFHHRKTIWRAVWPKDDVDADMIPMHVHSDTPTPPLNASPNIAPDLPGDLSLTLPSFKIAQNAPGDGVTTSALRGANVTRRQTLN